MAAEKLAPTSKPGEQELASIKKAGEKEIKALQDDEVMIMLDAVSTGTGLTEQELHYWERTKKRDTFYDEAELAFSEALGRKAKVFLSSGGKGTVEIEFFGKEDLGKLLQLFDK